MNKIILTLITFLAILNSFANESLDKAIILAHDKKASIFKVTEAAAEAVKNNPSPVEVFYIIVSQRRIWSTDELYALFNVILTESGLKEDICKNYGRLKPDSESAKLIRALQDYVADDDSFNQIMYRILTEKGGINYNNGSNINILPGKEKRDSRLFPVPVTPDPISSQN